MLTIKQVTEFLNVSRATVYRIIERGELPTYKVGIRGTRLKREDVEAYLKKQQQTSK